MVEQKCELQTLIHTMLHCIGRILVSLSHFTYVAMYVKANMGVYVCMYVCTVVNSFE